VKYTVEYLAFVFLLLLSTRSVCQYYSTGQDPASLQWRQIKTSKYQLIYPSPFEKKAQYLANIMDLLVSSETTTLKAKVPCIPIILHTQSTISNGFTIWAPKRIEMYSCPPQITYSEEWLEQLAIHEYRHAVQISKMNRGFTKALYYIFGEQATGGILGLYIPSWFLEGDATVTETTLSKSGRGRSALFESVLRTQILEKGIYSYDKAVLGSYKTFIPDPYSLGYYIVGQARKTYGPEIWNEALDRTAKYPFMVVPFSFGIHNVSDLTKTKLYKKTLKELGSEWQAQADSMKYTSFRFITIPDKRNYTLYTHPLFLNDSTILADKSCIDDIDRFVLIDRKTGKEKILLTPGSHVSWTVSISEDLLVWSEQEPDPRWQNKDYAEIKMYNFRTGRIRDLTHETRYFAPILSPDGKQVAAVWLSYDNETSLHILDTQTGMIHKEFTIDKYAQAITPNWSPDGTKIIFTYMDQRGQTIAEMDIKTGKINYLLPFTYNEFSGPAYFFSHYIVFSIDFNGIENIYAMDTVNSMVFKVTSSKFAGFDPDFSTDKKTMIYSDYTSDGLMVAESEVDTSTWIPLGQVKDFSIKLYKDLALQDNVNVQDSILNRRIFKMNQSDHYDLKSDTIDGKLYPTEKYSKLLHFYNPHSWAPASFDLDNMTLHPGVSVLSQNILSSAFAGAGYKYNINEMTGNVYANLTWAGWYPVLNLQVSYGQRASSYTIHPSEDKVRYTWNENNLSANVSILWNFSHGKFYRSLHPVIGTTVINVVHNASTPSGFTSGLIQSMDYSISATQFLHWVDKDMNPRWGQALAFNFRHTPFSQNDLGSIIALQTWLYFPGAFRHHSFWFYGGLQQRNDKTKNYYRFEDIISYPRGYNNAYDEKLFSLGFNYKLPLFYPDLSLSSLLYFKRFKLNLFFDFAEGFNPGTLNIYKSTGAELTTDFHILRFPIAFDMGVRSIYFPDDGTWGFEFLYAIRY